MQMIKNVIVFETYGFIKLDLTLIQGVNFNIMYLYTFLINFDCIKYTFFSTDY